MKSEKAKTESEEPAPKGKVKIKNLKLTKETIENLSDQDAGGIKGGASSSKTIHEPTSSG